jgi:hypothetical protein
MADKPILFSGPMVRALIAGSKTQTRRFLDGWTDEPPALGEGGRIIAFDENDRPYIWPRTHAVGDRLYVREHWRTGGQHDHIAPRDLPQEWAEPIGYIANEAPNTISRTGRFRQGMHMPRWASRITLTVSDVRVERLQDISEADALAEGMTQTTADAIMSPEELAVYATTHLVAPGARGRILYEHIWDHINGEGAWAANPWVAVYTFTAQIDNIDRLSRAA